MKVLWLSRHQMSPEQIEDLKGIFDTNEVEVESVNLVWPTSDSVYKDTVAAQGIWGNLVTKNAGVIAGVFPPIALASKPDGVSVWCPVSKQDVTLRKGEGTIPFRHCYFVEL